MHFTISHAVWVPTKANTMFVIGFHKDCGGAESCAWYQTQLKEQLPVQTALPLWRQPVYPSGEIRGLLGPCDDEALRDNGLAPFLIDGY